MGVGGKAWRLLSVMPHACCFIIIIFLWEKEKIKYFFNLKLFKLLFFKQFLMERCPTPFVYCVFIFYLLLAGYLFFLEIRAQLEFK
jgi:hypothetical protein